MKHQYWLFRRNGIYYLQDAQTGSKESLHTGDRREAQRLRDARDDATQNPNLGLALAKAYFQRFENWFKRPLRRSQNRADEAKLSITILLCNREQLFSCNIQKISCDPDARFVSG